MSNLIIEKLLSRSKRTDLPDFSRFGEIERKPMSSVRRKTAEHLSEAWGIPHVTHFDSADIVARKFTCLRPGSMNLTSLNNLRSLLRGSSPWQVIVELLLIATSLGIKLGYFRAFAIGGLEAVANNVLFVVPFELGAREGAYYVLFKLFGLDPQLGLYTSIVGRVRDLHP